MSEPELQHIVDDYQPKLLLHDRQYSEGAVRLVDHAAESCKVLCIVEGKSLTELRKCIRPSILSSPLQFAEKNLLIAYTSGTTGSPKGAVLGQRALRCNAQMAQHTYDMSAADVVLNYLPHF